MNQSKNRRVKFIGITVAVLALVICITAFAIFFASPTEEEKTDSPKPQQPHICVHNMLPQNIIVNCGNGNTISVTNSGSMVAVFGDGSESEVIYNHNGNGGFSIEINSSYTDKQGNRNEDKTDTDVSDVYNTNSNTENQKEETPVDETSAIVKKVAAEVSGKSDYEKVKHFHDYVCSHTVYDSKNVDNGIVTDEASSAYGALVQGVAVCSGYAKAFAELCKAVDIPVYYVYGPTEDSYHAWNIVKVDGAWYQVDLTWDDTDDGYNYDYFLVTDEYMEQSRDWDKADVPSCISEKYLWSAYPTANTLDEMEDIVAEAFRNGNGTVSIRTTFSVDLNSEQVSFLFNYDLNGNDTYEYYQPIHVGSYYLISIVL